jgi:hypothetical protein
VTEFNARPYRTIALTRGLSAIVDEDDFEDLSRFMWQAVPYGTNVYASRHAKNAEGRNSTILMHRHLLGLEPGDRCVDHVDGNGLNNKRENLRIVSKKENAWNRTRKAPGGSSRIKGVSRDGLRWRARITKEGKTITLGTFDTEESAGAAYEKAARDMFSVFASSAEAAE